MLSNRTMNFMKGSLATILVIMNTVIACTPLFLAGLIRLPLSGAARSNLDRSMDLVIEYWVGCNRLLFDLLRITNVEVTWDGGEGLSKKRWYIVISNHQSWTDILILQTRLFGHIPPIKFFTKQQLIWIPFLGVAMWLLGFPYVRRMSTRQIAENPKLAEIDRQSTLSACAGFRNHPTTVLNFLEGTRFTPEKHARQDARFQSLLNPKIGGLVYTLAALEDRLHYFVDVTIEYPDGIPTFWEFMKGECHNVQMLVHCRDIPATLAASHEFEDIRVALVPWIEDLWQEKDERLRAGNDISETSQAVL